ncbi:hypothetical protein KF707_13610 [Candidatus Obscuribacterales bacterium]|jgi:hypothetical protein|nr:hypothetical protein [Candidatus Obscuribacterales bacterium]MBX3137274.1 hypothetical protein [Candidatus Obscuribacterales bacterium]MBX3149200.1 hypothetical protein [Candidatus Obscuribacterales bacterium]
MTRLRRNRKGNQIAEFGPAIFILIIAILIPMLVMIYVGFGFCCGWYLNFMSVRAAAVAQKANLQQALDAQLAAWNASGLPQFAGATMIANGGPPDGSSISTIRYNVDTDLDLTPGPNGGPRQPVELDDFVCVVTKVRISPLLQIPLIPIQPWEFTYRSERPIEEADVEQ